MRPKREITPEQYKRVLSPCRPQLRRAVADHPCQGRRHARIHEPALRALGQAVRSLRSRAQARGQALCPPRLHHRRLRRSCCRPICASSRASSISEDLPLNISREMLQNNPMLARMRSQITQARAWRAREEGQGRARGIRQILGQFRRRAERGPLRGPRASRPMLPLAALPLDRGRRPGLARRLCRADEAGAGGDLLHHRRQARDACARARSSKASAPAASRSCC